MTAPAYYNEIDGFAAQWLRNLIEAGHIPAGEVDERSIEDVQPEDLRGFRQCHFFAGIGGGALSCRLAGLPDDCPIWTGGPPCQDNSNAAAIHGGRVGLRGARSGLAHTWVSLVETCRPGLVVFENVPGITPWLAEIQGRLARTGYHLSRRDRPASSVGAPHLRRRVFLVANADGAGLPESGTTGPSPASGQSRGTATGNAWDPDNSWFGVLDDGLSERLAGVRSSVIKGFGNAWVPQAAAQVIREAVGF